MKNLLIDLEFTGLDNSFVKDNEIVQLKLMDVDNGNFVCVDCTSVKPVSLYHRVFCGRIDDYAGTLVFSTELFNASVKLLVNTTDDIIYHGYSVQQDLVMLKKYDINIEIVDLQEKMRLNPEYEKILAVECASMESAYFLLTGKVPPLNTHWGSGELDLLREIYQAVEKFADNNELLTIMPWGHCAGMPLEDYVEEYRRAADGYRLNNDDLLAESLTAVIPSPVPYYNDDDCDYEDCDYEDEDEE
jgi:hypothetical protein